MLVHAPGAPELVLSREEEAPLPVLPGEPVAYDERGRPMIVRQVDDESGRVRHIVRNEDGTVKAFGHSTVSSLVDSSDDDASRWVNDLTLRELRALVHDVGQRLLNNSRLYELRQAELERLADAADCAYFGVPQDAVDRELDNAYRKMAKRMHPDKNGGTDSAKARFQHMKERYEAVKARRGRRQEKSKQQEQQAEEEEGNKAPGADEDASAKPSEPQRREAYDEDDPPAEPKSDEQDRTIAYDPTDRKSLRHTVWKMLGQFKTMQQGLRELERQLGRAASQYN